MVLGVLEADPALRARDRQAGITFATLNLQWSQWEPRRGLFDARYRAAVVAEADGYRAAGWRVAVDIGLQSAPRWALALPGGRLVDQHGRRSATADFEFSQAVRAAASPYITSVVRSMGRVVDYRVGLSGNGETYYPDTTANGWWAFSGQAQGTAPGRPAGVGADPMRGWVPGTATWHGARVSAAAVSSWYDWYFGAMVNAHAWEIHAYRSAGYGGQLELVMPGTGALPAFYAARLAAGLAPGSEDGFSTLNSGAVWWKLLDDLGSSLSNTAVDISSVYDRSGRPRGNTCQVGDSSVALGSHQIWGWSDTRWLAYLARAHRLPVMGENPGATPASDLRGTFGLVRSCGLTALQWAWDFTLGNGGAVGAEQLHAAAGRA